jgi:hypothetical protein
MGSKIAGICSGSSCMSEPTFESPADRPKVGPVKHPGRSRITNGSAFLPGIDNRGPWIRRCKDVIAAHLSDLGGLNNTSAAERSIIRRVGVLTAELEHLEVRFATAEETDAADLDLYQRMTNTLRRSLESIGLQRRTRDVTPTVAEYLKHVDGEAE